MNKTGTFLIWTLLFISSCTRVGPDPETPEVNLPNQWANHASISSGDLEQDCKGATERQEWWIAFQDPCLEQLIKKALENNPEVFIAMHRIDEYHFLITESKANFFPIFYMGGRYGNVQTPEGSVLYQQPSLNTFLNNQNIKLNRHYEFFNIGPTVSWEIDIFGRLRSENLARKAEYQASIENLRAVQLSITAEVARNYILLKYVQEKLRQEEEYQTKLISRIEVLLGRLSLQKTNLEQVSQAEIHVLEGHRRLIRYKTEIDKLKRRILTLLGEADGCYDDCFLKRGLPQPVMPINPGIPSDLLIQRPDVAQADRELAASTYRIGKVMAEALPNFVIFGTVGGISKNIFELLSYKNLYWIFDPFVTFPLFDAGNSEATINEYSAKANKAIANYQKTLLQAVEEVQIALYEVRGNEEEITKIRQLHSKVSDNFDRKKLLYEKGLADFNLVSLAEDELHQRQIDLLQSLEKYATDFVTLCKALGGKITF